MPFWIAGMYSRGTEPPLIESTNTRSSPASSSSLGAKRTFATAN